MRTYFSLLPKRKAKNTTSCHRTMVSFWTMLMRTCMYMHYCIRRSFKLSLLYRKAASCICCM